MQISNWFLCLLRVTRTRHWNHGLTRSYINTKFIQAQLHTTPSSTLSRNINSRHSLEGQPNDVDGFCSVRLPHDVPQQSIWLIGQWQIQRQPQANILTREPSQVGEAIYHFPLFWLNAEIHGRRMGDDGDEEKKTSVTCEHSRWSYHFSLWCQVVFIDFIRTYLNYSRVRGTLDRNFRIVGATHLSIDFVCVTKQVIQVNIERRRCVYNVWVGYLVQLFSISYSPSLRQFKFNWSFQRISWHRFEVASAHLFD